MAYEYLMEKIMDESLNSSEIYSEEKIAQELGISRTPVRAALQRLNHDNYIDIIPYRGFMLHQVSISDITQSFQLRCAIEGYCCAYIAKQYKKERAIKALAQIKDLYEQQKAIYEKHKDVYKKNEDIYERREEIKLNEFLELDIKFHKLIVEYAENKTFNSIFNSYISTIKFLARSYFKSVMPITIDEHYNIYMAMAEGDDVRSYNMLVKHMETPTELYLQKFNTSLFTENL
jgi:DNA-binding GntR family transcriptional regulator